MIPHHESPPSPRTRELADLLGKVVEEYEKYHPAITGREVRSALRLAERSSHAAAAGGRTMALVGGALGAVVAGTFIWVANRGGSWEGGAPVALVAAIIAVLAVGLIVRRARGD